MSWRLKRAHRHIGCASSCAMQRVFTQLRGVNCMRKMTCEVYLSTHPVDYSGSPSTVNETNCTKKKIFKKNLMSSFPILVPPLCARRGMPYNVLFWMDRLFNLFPWFVVYTIFHWDSGSKIRSKFHRPMFACFVEGEIPLSLVSFVFLWGEMIRVIFFCKFVHQQRRPQGAVPCARHEGIVCGVISSTRRTRWQANITDMASP